MRSSRLSIGLRATLAILAVTLFVSGPAVSQETVLHTFVGSSTDGSAPQAGLIFDAAGNLYGTTYQGGAYGAGAVFELEPKAGGGWTENVLYSFCLPTGCTDGAQPYASLTFDTAGNLYGTTIYGGALGYGTVFELTPATGGMWTEKVLHSFNNNVTDGFLPESTLIFDAAGNLYGTTQQGGRYSRGIVFELITARGMWAERVLHSFGNGTDGAYCYAGLILDAAGNLYGSTNQGGASGKGMVFELTPTANGAWTEKVLHSFGSGTDGANPYGTKLIFDASGNLYGTTYYGGAHGLGTVFELAHVASRGWRETVLYAFGNSGTDGNSPSAGLIFDALGNLYGTTTFGGSGTCSIGGFVGCGTIFKMTPQVGGGWTESVLYSFNNNGADGNAPYAGLIFDAAGNLYGTTFFGGADNYGTVVELTP